MEKIKKSLQIIFALFLFGWLIFSDGEGAQNARARLAQWIPDFSKADYIVGTWDCRSTFVDSEGNTVKVNGVSTYRADGSYTATATTTMSAPGGNGTLEMRTSESGAYQIADAILEVTFKGASLNLVILNGIDVTNSPEIQQDFQQTVNLPGEKSTYKILHLSSDEVAVSDPEHNIQSCDRV